MTKWRALKHLKLLSLIRRLEGSYDGFKCYNLVPNVLVGNAYRAVWYGNARAGELNLQYAFPIRRSGTRGSDIEKLSSAS